jgi:hypothetical protein
MKNLSKLFAAILIAVCCFTASYAQTISKNEKAAKVAGILTSMNYIFKPTSAVRGNLTPKSLIGGSYDVAVSKDAIKIYLPFLSSWGKEYMDPYNGGFDYSSDNFDYKADVNKSGDWSIVINTKTLTNFKGKYKFSYQLTLNVGRDGYATLLLRAGNNVLTYNGFVESNEVTVAQVVEK